MKITFHGAAREVGKSCIEVETENKRYIMDAGIKFITGGVEYPTYLEKIYDIDGVFISHAHLDHSGALPLLEHKNLSCPIYLTNLTWKITNLLLQDSYHLEKLKHIHPAYVERDITKIKSDLRFVKYDQEYETHNGKVKFQFLNAGHIPGSSSILLKLEGKTLLYTADLNTEKTNLMIESDIEHLENQIDILITENTYGDRRHPDREFSESGLLKSVEEGIRGGGSVLIPVFGVGRSQEILMILSKLPKDIPIYLDGMARKLTELILNTNDPYIKNKEILEHMYKRVNIIQNPRERDRIKNMKKIVIVTTSGMVQGGPVVSYMDSFINEKDNFIILTGYQAKGTNGRSIFEDHLYYQHHQRFPVKAHVRKFDFSAHYGQDKIHKLIEKIKPKNLILQHGDPDAIASVKHWVKENFPEINVWDPDIGDSKEY
jgi:putative mRNA 3-end processing factor